jgi:repressor LexA
MSETTKLASLTPRQRDIFEFLKDKILNRGYGPTVREIGLEFGIRSPNGVMCHLKALEKKGLISRESHMSRAIQLADKPHRATSIAMLGQVSSGNPLKAAKDGEVVDFMDVFGTGDHACVKANDDSFSHDGIDQGDYVVIRKQESCRDGDSILALVDGRDAVLRRYFTDSKGVRLEPLTSNRKALHATNVTVLGVVVGVVRKL